MAATKWDNTVGDTRTLRLRDATAVAELVITTNDDAASAVLHLYDVTGNPDPDPAGMNNTTLRETRAVTGQFLDWVAAGRKDPQLWQLLKGAVDSSATRRQKASDAVDAAVAAVVALIPDVDPDDLARVVRPVVVDALPDDTAPAA